MEQADVTATLEQQSEEASNTEEKSGVEDGNAYVTQGTNSEHKKVGKKNGGSKENLNQEDIDAVQFLASEFSKEITTTKPSDGKTTIEIETVDGNMIEVAAIQGVIASVPDSEEQDEAVARLTAEIREANEALSLEASQLAETQSRKRKLKAEDREFKCGYCVKSFSMKIALEKHLVAHGANLPWQCADCPEGFMKSVDYKEHCNKVHDNFRPFPCLVCGKRLSNLGILKNHQGIHSGERPFVCQFSGCKKSFLTKTNLDDHERKHVNAREFECGTCQKRFNLKGDLRQHEKVHKEEKPFRCEFCDMSFPRGPSLWRHRRTHTGEKPYQCDICEKRFSRMENCQEHRRIHTGERPLVCPVCGKAFRDSGNFSNHKKIHKEGYVPRKKKGAKKTKEKNVEKAAEQATHLPQNPSGKSEKEAEAVPSQEIPQDVAFIVAPMQPGASEENMNLTVANSAAESSYVQVGNFLLTLEMEAAFKQMMQQQGGNNEIVTLTTTDGKSLEFITDPSQAEALMQVAAQSQGSTELLQDVQDVIKQNLMQIGSCKALEAKEEAKDEEETAGVALVEIPENTEIDANAAADVDPEDAVNDTITSNAAVAEEAVNSQLEQAVGVTVSQEALKEVVGLQADHGADRAMEIPVQEATEELEGPGLKNL